MTKIHLNIEGVHCKSCKMVIEDNLQELGAKEIHVTVDEKKKTGTVTCEYDGDPINIVNSIKKEGYKVLK